MQATSRRPPQAGELDRLWSSWMAAAQGGDRTAYERLLRDCVPHVRRVAHRVGVASAHTDDVVQEVLLSVHRARHTYDPRRSFTAWLNAIAQHRAVDLLRQTGRLGHREVHDPLALDSCPDEAGPGDALDQQEHGRDLRVAVARLPDAQREAVEALALREMSLAETAALTGRSTGALKVNLHRALKSLRQVLARPE